MQAQALVQAGGRHLGGTRHGAFGGLRWLDLDNHRGPGEDRCGVAGDNCAGCAAVDRRVNARRIGAAAAGGQVVRTAPHRRLAPVVRQAGGDRFTVGAVVLGQRGRVQREFERRQRLADAGLAGAASAQRVDVVQVGHGLLSARPAPPAANGAAVSP
jgi:hypothetical protein